MRARLPATGRAAPGTIPDSPIARQSPGRGGSAGVRPYSIRPARRADAANLAVLDDISSHGLASACWRHDVRLGKGETAFDLGRRRMMGSERNGWQSCEIAEIDGLVAGMISAYPMPGLDAAAFDVPTAAQPVLELMAMACGSWFVDALAVYPEYRRLGAARALLGRTFEQARLQNDEVDLVVQSDNEAALGLYRSFGFRPVTEKPCLTSTGKPVEGRNHILMSVPIAD